MRQEDKLGQLRPLGRTDQITLKTEGPEQDQPLVSGPCGGRRRSEAGSSAQVVVHTLPKHLTSALSLGAWLGAGTGGCKGKPNQVPFSVLRSQGPNPESTAGPTLTMLCSLC